MVWCGGKRNTLVGALQVPSELMVWSLAVGPDCVHIYVRACISFSFSTPHAIVPGSREGKGVSNIGTVDRSGCLLLGGTFVEQAHCPEVPQQVDWDIINHF